MNILVCISHVPDTTSKINFVMDNTLFKSKGVQYIINPNDEFGLTRAIWFKEKHGATVHVIHVGTAAADPTLRKCLAIGADKAYRIDTPAHDGNHVAHELAAFLKTNSHDLIIAGRESIDYNGGMVPGILAGILNMPFIPNCVGLEIDGNTATGEREIDGGREKLKGTLPMVIGGQKGLVEESDLKIPNMRGIMQARQKPFEVIPSSNAMALTKEVSFEKPAPKAAVKLVPADDIDQLIELLHKEANVI
ncbi:MAG: electron transfer flavoprotein subunit beta/FixA family protein [Flavobacteriaceae bacterium]|nr:electron transfer flavoprotein subunit beta/FixA family protein [Flavobacteriaceae bacterium]